MLAVPGNFLLLWVNLDFWGLDAHFYSFFLGLSQDTVQIGQNIAHGFSGQAFPQPFLKLSLLFGGDLDQRHTAHKGQDMCLLIALIGLEAAPLDFWLTLPQPCFHGYA